MRKEYEEMKRSGREYIKRRKMKKSEDEKYNL